jgi:hypothetical protein
MVLFIGLILLFGGRTYLAIKKMEKKTRRSRAFCCIVLAMLLGVIFSLLVSSFFVGVLPRSTESQEFGKTELFKIKGPANSQDSTFVFAGVIGNDKYYYVCYQTADGEEKYTPFLAKQVKIFEEDRSTAYQANVFEKKCSSQVYFWLIPSFFDFDQAVYKTTVIHVPRWTITHGLNIP